ncbi:MAG: hypothetical protein ACWA41_12825 [Putridiphycobacter sp.]
MIFDINNRIYKGISFTVVFSLLFEIIFPTVTFAQSGPTQPETSGYNHSSGGENVDNFTGDFSYSIPLIDIEGYPLILSYNSNVTMTQEASWVGLGWSLNPGSIARQMRGIPDEFNGNDKVHRKFKRKASKVDGAKAGASASAAIPLPNLPYVTVGGSISFLEGMYYNNYRGYGRTLDVTVGANISATLSQSLGLAATVTGVGLGAGAGVGGSLGFSFDSQNGIGFNPGFNFGVGGQFLPFSGGYSGAVSTSISTREGQKARTYYSTVTGGVFTYSKSNTSASIKTFGTQTYIPRFAFDMHASSYTNRRGGGLYANVLIAQASFNGIWEKYSSTNEFVENEIDVPAYGYQNLELADEDDQGLMDFNREKERIFSKDMKSLPFSNITYDLYQVNTPGVSTMFRAYRNDVGTLSDATVNHSSIDSSKITSRSYGVWYKRVEGDGDGTGTSESGDWESDNGSDLLAFKDKSEFVLGVEKFNFKVVGEKTPTDMGLYNAYGENTPNCLHMAYNPSTNVINTTGYLFDLPNVTSQPNVTSLPLTNYRQEREIRGTNISYLYNFERETLNEEIKSYDLYTENSDGQVNSSVVSDDYRKEHHIGKMAVTTTSGYVYGYGIPVYNINESEVAFNVEPQSGDLDANTGLVKYNVTGNADNSLQNEKGRDHFYDKTTTPAYAHSYLLTDIKSSDYIDKTGDGLSADDIGSYVKFNYSRVYGGTNPYKWRFPVSEEASNPVANYNAGFETDPLDDKGFYSYGEKEIWYPNSIETKNFILEFYIEDTREDAYPVMGENGELDLSKPSYLLRKIVLYSREDRLKNGTNATPIKTVEFDYNYSLCRNNPSNKNTGTGTNYSDSGKLTLKSIRFTSGKSKVTYQSPYIFTYSENNPDYNSLDMDRWANYKPNNLNKDNLYFPYSVQDTQEANDNIQAWKLKRIVYPTGGGMEVDYEADTYANIQNKNVMRHYEIIGMSNFKDLIGNIYNSPSNNYETSEPNYSNVLRDVNNKKRPNNVIYFKLDEPIASPSKSLAELELKEKYFTYFENGQKRTMDEIYYRTKIEINEEKQIGEEFIPGFAGIKPNVTTNDEEYKNYKSEINSYTGNNFSGLDGIGLVGSEAGGTYYYGYLIVETEGIKDKLKDGNWVDKGYAVNPLQKNAWNFIRLNMPWHIYAECEDSNGDPDIEDCDYGIGADWKTIFTGKINKVLNNNEYCLNVNTDLSTVRLMDSRGYKYGGNARVKSITYFDSWDEISGELEASYTLEYNYESYHHTYNGTPFYYTSGVAAYEPINGKDENIYFQPTYFDIENRLKPDDHHYQIDPIGESVFPAPTVGYSEVTIKFKDIANLTRNSTGQTSYFYYTYKDYPILVNKSFLQVIDYPKKMENTSFYKVFGASQGFVVELNDMHGKAKEVKVVDANSNEISKTTYSYYNFDEKQKVVNENGGIEEHYLGKEIDIYADKKMVEQLNIDVMNMTTKEFGIIPVPNITHSVSNIKIFNAFYAATFQKVINHTAVLKEVKQTYLGQKSDVKAMAYDKYTGNPIVSTSKNEFGDNDFSVSYPAQWRYKELQSKYKNDRLLISNLNVDNSSNLTGLNNPEDYLLIGDQLIIYDNVNQTYFPAIVKDIFTNNNTVQITDLNGNDINANTNALTVLIADSKYKNRLSENMASFYIKNDPITGYTSLTIDPTKVIQSSAVEYVENNARVGENEFGCSGINNPNFSCNEDLSDPYRLGIIGNWRPSKVYAFQSERINNNTLNSTDIRNDGAIQSFVPFYAFSGGKWNSIVEAGHPNYINPIDLQNWRILNQVTQFDRFGKTIETRSQLGIYSSILYGYNNNFKMIPIAAATNAKVTQIAYDGFEDYMYLDGDINCNTTGHFDFKDVVPLSRITTEDRHTGNYALKMFPGNSYSVSRKLTGHENDVNYELEQKFSPTEGKYVIGAWVKQKESAALTDYPNAAVKVEIFDNVGTIANTFTFNPSGKIVEGWQRIEGVFELPAYSDKYCIQITLENGSDQIMYFDDLRIHPFESSMQTMVYDATLLLPMATLNDYNYATYFMYDENLSRVRVRQETERGIYTLSEMNLGIKK